MKILQTFLSYIFNFEYGMNIFYIPDSLVLIPCQVSVRVSACVLVLIPVMFIIKVTIQTKRLVGYIPVLFFILLLKSPTQHSSGFTVIFTIKQY